MTELVLGVDSSTTATKVIALDKDGKQHGEGRSTIDLHNPKPSFFEQDTNQWWTSFVEATKDLATQVDLSNAVALAISNQRETMGFLDQDCNPIAPAVTWMDVRCSSVLDSFAAKFGEEKLLQITGKHKDTTPATYTLAWMRENTPEVLEKTKYICDVQAFLVKNLTDNLASSWASADPFGVWDMEPMRTATQVLDALDLAESNFPSYAAPGAVLGKVTNKAAQATGLSEGMLIVGGGGDGQCAGLASGVIKPGVAYINLGTAIVAGSYSDNYNVGDAWRTLTSVSAKGYINESVLITGTFLTNWMVKNIFGLEGNSDDYAKLEQEANKLKPGCDGLMMLPYFLGVCNPHWNPNARGAMFGLSGHHTRAHLYRALLESIALDQANSFLQIEESTGVKLHTFYAVGGGSNSDLWCQICANCLDCKVARLATAEASALGAGIAATIGADLHPDFETAVENMGGEITSSFEPDDDAQSYKNLVSTFSDLYPASIQGTKNFS